MRAGRSWAKKQEHGDPEDPADAQKGDWWDHKGSDPNGTRITQISLETKLESEAFLIDPILYYRVLSLA